MKANEAPKKIYLDPALDALTKALSEKTEDDVEYTRTDAFIKKACEFLETYPHMFMGKLRSEMIEDFKKYIEK